VSASSLSTALDALITAAGFTVGPWETAAAIPAHRAGLDVVCRVDREEGVARARSRDVMRATIATVYPSTMAPPAGARSALSGMETIRDALLAASALATVPARVIALDMAQEPTGAGSVEITITAEIHALR
jgi:hypothetical protein